MIIGISGKALSGKDTVTNIIQWLILKEEKNVEIAFEDFEKYSKASDWKNVKFADKLKDMVCLLLGCTREQLEDPKFKETELGKEWIKYKLSYTFHERLSYCNCPSYYKKYFCTKEEAIEYVEGNLEVDQDSIKISKIELTPRLLLQLLGTECGRKIIHPNIWVNATFTNFADKEEWFRKETGLTRTEYITKNGHSDEYKTLNEQFFKSLPNWIISDVRFLNEAKAIKDRNGILIRLNRNIGLESMHESETALDNYDDWDYIIENNDTIEDLIEKVKEILIKEKIIWKAY